MSSDAGRRGAGGRSLPGRPVLLLGLDGVGFPFLEAPAVADSTPNLRSLLDASTAGPLLSTFPPYTAPSWTSITTGVDPGRHGIFGFTDARGRPVSDLMVAAPRLWDYVGDAGGRSIVVNVPITHPPRPIEGMLVSGMPTPAGTAFTSPQPLAAELERFSYTVDVPVREGGREGAGTFEKLRRMTEARGRTATWLAGREPWDLFAIVFVIPDRLGHPWWKQLVPGHPLYETRAAERVRRAAGEALRALDDAIGALLAAIPPSTAVVTCSDHGFGPLRADLFFDLVLAESGLIADGLAGPFRRSRSAAGRSRLARSAPRALRRWVTGATAGTSGERRAWTAPPYESGVRLGDPEHEGLRAQVTELLVSLRDPDGVPLVRTVTPRAELYQGPACDGAPDLLCQMADESVELHDGMHAGHPWVSRDTLPWGTHAAEGIVAVAGAGATGPVQGRAPDVAATVLTLLGVNVEGLDGQSLVAPLGGGRVTAGPSARPTPDPAAGAYSADEEAAVLEHLRGLGYVD